MVNVDGYNVIISYPRTWTKHGTHFSTSNTHFSASEKCVFEVFRHGKAARLTFPSRYQRTANFEYEQLETERALPNCMFEEIPMFPGSPES